MHARAVTLGSLSLGTPKETCASDFLNTGHLVKEDYSPWEQLSWHGRFWIDFFGHEMSRESLARQNSNKSFNPRFEDGHIDNCLLRLSPSQPLRERTTFGEFLYVLYLCTACDGKTGGFSGKLNVGPGSGVSLPIWTFVTMWPCLFCISQLRLLVLILGVWVHGKFCTWC